MVHLKHLLSTVELCLPTSVLVVAIRTSSTCLHFLISLLLSLEISWMQYVMRQLLKHKIAFSEQEEVHEHYGTSSDEVMDILVSCDRTWQKCGFSSLLGAVFIIAYETGKVVDYIVLSKYCAGCKQWDDRDKSSAAYAEWKAKHDCSINFSGSAGAMEPIGTLKMFQCSLNHLLRYKSLISA